MPWPRKACKALVEPLEEEEEVGHEYADVTLLREEAFSPTLPACQADDSKPVEGASGASSDSLKQSVGGASSVAYARNLSNGVVANDRDKSNSHSGRKVKAAKTVRVSEEARLKKITITCEWNMCTMVFNKVERFISHMTEHLLAITEPVSNDGYLCYWRECDFACSAKEEMDRHVYYHAYHCKIKSIGSILMEERKEKCILDSSGRNLIPEIPEFFQCKWEDCIVKFASAHDFYCHVLSHVRNTEMDYPDKKAYVCAWDGCCSSFSIQARLRDHVRGHTQERVVGCPNCGGIFASNSAFFDHCIRQMPVESHQYQCSYCLRRFASEKLLRWHVRQHIKQCKCTECDLTVDTKATLKVHKLYRHEKCKPHNCLQCGKGFTLPADVTRHRSVHSDEPANECLFRNCTYKIRSKAALDRHIRVVHKGLDIHHYVCHVCDSRFTIGNYLTKHLVKRHNFTLPAGHTRFRYKQDEDGFYRLETIRYERRVSDEEEDEEAVDSPETSTYPSSPASLSTQSSQLTPTKLALQQNLNNEDGGNQDLQQLC